MVQLDKVRSAVSALAKTKPLVAVFVGGTSGIGEYTIRVLAAVCANGGRARVYIVGRNAKTADVIISDCARISPHGRFVFVQARDLSLLKDVDRVCAEIVGLESREVEDGGRPKIDLLVMSQACSVFQKRKGKYVGSHGDSPRSASRISIVMLANRLSQKRKKASISSCR